MLVRRRVLDELGGFDDELPIFGNDLDFGWRAAAAGHTTVVVPQAVVFHAEAAHRGLPAYAADRPAHPLPGAARRAVHAARQLPVRGAAAAGRPAGVRHRSSGCSASWRPVAGGGPGRPRGARLGRTRTRRAARRAAGPARPRPTADPDDRRRAAGAVLAALPARARLRQRPGDRAHPARPPTWPSGAARRPPSATRRRSRRAARRSGSGSRTTRWSRTPGWSPASSPTRSPCCSPSSCSRAGRRPRRARRTSPAGARRPRPTGWTRLVAAAPRVLAPARARHRGPGAAVRAAAGAAGHRARRQPGGAVSALLVLAVPVALWGAWRFLRVAGRLVDPGRREPLADPVGRDDVRPGPGRLRRLGRGPARRRWSSAALLPWLAHAALGFADPEADRRWRAAWRTGLLLALVSCVHAGRLAGRRARRRGRGAARVHAAAAASAGTARPGGRRSSRWRVVPVLLAPWWLPALLHGAGEGLLLDGGLLPVADPRRPRPAGSAGSTTSARRGGSASCCRCSRCWRWCPRRPGSRC